MDPLPRTERATVRRHAERGVYERDAIDAILDEALVCDVAYVDPDGHPRAVPMIHARVGDTLYLHASTASSTTRTLAAGAEVCLVATLLDGLVLARSAFSHSMNYRSAIVYGTSREVTDPDERDVALRALVDHVVAGRSADARMPNERELAQTAVLAVPIEEASAKIRSGPPQDDEADLALPIWAGVLPLRLTPGEPEDDPSLGEGLTPPDLVRDFRRP